MVHIYRQQQLVSQVTHNYKEELFNNWFKEKCQNGHRDCLVIQDNENGNVYTNTKLINEIIHLGVNADELEEVILIYKYHFEIIKLFIDELFTSLFQIKENTPYMIRAICTIISKLFSIKFKEASNIIKKSRGHKSHKDD